MCSVLNKFIFLPRVCSALLIKRHSELGYRLLLDIDTPFNILFKRTFLDLYSIKKFQK